MVQPETHVLPLALCLCGQTQSLSTSAPSWSYLTPVLSASSPRSCVSRTAWAFKFSLLFSALTLVPPIFFMSAFPLWPWSHFQQDPFPVLAGFYCMAISLESLVCAPSSLCGLQGVLFCQFLVFSHYINIVCTLTHPAVCPFLVIVCFSVHFPSILTCPGPWLWADRVSFYWQAHVTVTQKAT